MSSTNVYTAIARIMLYCDRCDAQWESEPTKVDTWLAEIEATKPAFDTGWRIYVGARSRRTYCPEHGPTVSMRQVYPKEQP